MLAQDPKPPRNVGSRRIFPAMFKLTVLDAYRLDPECKGNQRATARKFNVHRRQIQKWLQSEQALRASVHDAVRYDSNVSTQAATPTAEPRLLDPASRVYKHDARTLKLVAQRLYPSSCGGAMHKSIHMTDLVPKEYQLNDTRCEAIASSGYKLASEPVPSLILKDGGLKMCGSETLTLSKSPVSPTMSSIPARPQPLFSAPNSPYNGDEPYNLVVKSQPTALRPATPVAASSPLPARVAEIVADSKSSAFSPKRKWLQDSLQENDQTEPLPLIAKPAPDEPKPKRALYDFSIERLCGHTKEIEVKTEVPTPPPSTIVPSLPPPPQRLLQFPPPLLMPHRTIPDLKTLHFRPDMCEPVQVKEERMSEDEEDVDVISTSPCEDKTFDFSPESPECKRRSYSVQFKLDVLDAYHRDRDCNQNQRATARKFNINRRQVSKWLTREDELRTCEGGECAQCPRHCVAPYACPAFSALPPYPAAYGPWMAPPARIF